MLTRSRSRFGWHAVGALALVAGTPALSHAQQSGLFPLLPIQRERTPCAIEDPVYRLYRHEYFGYHPTCWRKFPSGWGCPSPEGPNAAESFRQIPRDVIPEEGGPETPGEMAPGARPDAMPGNVPSPNALPPLPAPERSPFDLDTKPETPPARPGARNMPGDTPPASDAPEGLRPGGRPGGSASNRDGFRDDPLLALPDPTLDPPARGAHGSAPAGVNDLGPTVSTSPLQAPSRPSLISGLFSGRLLRRR